MYILEVSYKIIIMFDYKRKTFGSQWIAWFTIC